MRLPSWEELIAQQRDILDYPLDKPLFVVGPPGSGKTILAVQRAEMQAREGAKVAFITYNRMLRRLSELLRESRAELWTMHTFVGTHYTRRIGSQPPMDPFDTYDHDWNRIIDTLAEHSTSSQRDFDHIIIDEGQDLSAGFFVYASKYAGTVLTVFADDDQALEAKRTTLEEIQAATSLPDPIILQHNHRNSPEIARVAEHFHSGRLPAAAVRRSATTELPRLIRSPSHVATAQMIGRWQQTRGGRTGVVVYKNATGKLVRDEICRLHPHVRVDVYDSKHKNEAAIALLEPGVTVLNRRSVKGQEFDAVFVMELEQFIPCQNPSMRRNMYMLCTRARDHLMLVYGPGVLSPLATAALPGSHLLERS